jgi:hypothetical protein
MDWLILSAPHMLRWRHYRRIRSFFDWTVADFPGQECADWAHYAGREVSSAGELLPLSWLDEFQRGARAPEPRYIRFVRYFLRRSQPPVSRILLIESGSRHLIEHVLPGLRRSYGESIPIDLVTCYTGAPEGIDAIYRVADYRGAAGRRNLYRALAIRRYPIVGMICSAEPIMTKWKWSLAARLPSKVFVINENGDYFWLDRGHWRAIRHFILFRAGLSGAGAARTLGRLAVFPFTLLYLLLYASTVHIRRVLRKGYP